MLPSISDRNLRVGDGILLFANLPPGRVNLVPLEASSNAWFMEDYNPSTGYTWRFIPDQSGVYQMIRQIILRGSTGMVGVPGKIIWIIKPVGIGSGTATFALYPPGSQNPAKTDIVTLNVR